MMEQALKYDDLMKHENLQRNDACSKKYFEDMEYEPDYYHQIYFDNRVKQKLACYLLEQLKGNYFNK